MQPILSRNIITGINQKIIQEIRRSNTNVFEAVKKTHFLNITRYAADQSLEIMVWLGVNSHLPNLVQYKRNYTVVGTLLQLLIL